MELVSESQCLDDYLAETEEVNYNHPLIQALLRRFVDCSAEEQTFVRMLFEYVRDEIVHSWDIRSRRVTRRASDVLLHREGICYAKANLLAALLRGSGIPAGFGYQKLTIGDMPDSGYCIHALNAVYLESERKWIRLDARGNKPGVQAAFSVTEEKLAFPVRTFYGEEDYPVIYAQPNRKTMDTLRNHTDCMDMCLHHLPVSL